MTLKTVIHLPSSSIFQHGNLHKDQNSEQYFDYVIASVILNDIKVMGQQEKFQYTSFCNTLCIIHVITPFDICLHFLFKIGRES